MIPSSRQPIHSGHFDDSVILITYGSKRNKHIEYWICFFYKTFIVLQKPKMS